MEKYIHHLLQDIAAATATNPYEVPYDGPEPDTFEAHIWEVERYLHEDPDTTLGQYLGLERVQFPDEGQLTDEQCAAVFEALEKAYFSYGVTMEIPEGIPLRACYRTAVEALDKAVFVSRHGHVGIEYCDYDFDGYCPFGVEKCPCYVEWEAGVKNGGLMLEPELDRLDAEWYRLLHALADARTRFGAAQTPKREAVRTICQQLEETWLVMYRDDFSIWYRPPQEEVPDTPGRSLQGWAGCPEPVFPPFSQLHPLEAELLTLALLRLLGKEYIFLSVIKLEQPELYEALARHFSCELRKDEASKYFRLLCPPGQLHLYERFKDEKGMMDEERYARDEEGEGDSPDDLPF
jgi:hypothetical protein